jgi:hypothetical protein
MRYPREPLYREFYGRQKVDPQAQVNHLLDFLKVAPHLVPKAEQLNVATYLSLTLATSLALSTGNMLLSFQFSYKPKFPSISKITVMTIRRISAVQNFQRILPP